MTHQSIKAMAVFAGLLLGPSVMAAEQTMPLTSLDLTLLEQSFGKPTVDRSVEGNPLSIGGKTFAHGLGSHADSRQLIAVNGATRFTAVVGIDDDVAQRGRVRFRVIGDAKTLFDSGTIKGGEAGKPVDVSLAGVKQLLLITTAVGGINYCHADWADAQFTVDGDAPKSVEQPPEPAEILTPPPPHTPRINGAKVFGVRPSHPILFSIAATGDRPMTFKADGVPDGATFDPQTGRLGGAVAAAGTYVIHFTATNSLGTISRDFKLVVGDKLALTPLMGWNSWYGFADRVTDERMRFAADQIVKLGLADHGFTYVDIDDFWQQTPGKMAKDPTYGGPGRDANGNIVANNRFPDMKALADYIHSRGLRAGLYSSPGPRTCGGALGSYDHEAADAKQYADWGFDLLKYDWCSYNPGMEEKRTTPVDFSKLPMFGQPEQKGLDRDVRPYALMGDLLQHQSRDIFLSMCQYGNGHSWTWGASAGGQSARTTGDVDDTWGSVSSIGFDQANRRGTSGPGFWGDPDMLMIGFLGIANPHPTRLTPNEQYTQVTLWSLLPAPLLFSAHLDKLDPFTMNLLTNDEVIAVDQDSLGKSAVRVSQDDDMEVWSRDLDDGSKAVALFNRGEVERPISVNWKDIGITGPQVVRDLWRQKDLGAFNDTFSTPVGRHGVVFVKVYQPTDKPK